jgi:hypothetical protein
MMRLWFIASMLLSATLTSGIARAGGDGMPNAFPLPMYHEHGASNVHYRIDMSQNENLQYDVPDDMKVVVDWYRDRLRAQGFKIVMDQEFKDASGYTRGMAAWSRCQGNKYASVQVGSMASAGNSSTPDKPGAEITMTANGGC